MKYIFNAREALYMAIEKYHREVFEETMPIPSDVHRMTAGVEAFIHTNYWKEPYFTMDFFELEKPKKWYQFWRKG